MFYGKYCHIVIYIYKVHQPIKQFPSDYHRHPLHPSYVHILNTLTVLKTRDEQQPCSQPPYSQQMTISCTFSRICMQVYLPQYYDGSSTVCHNIYSFLEHTYISHTSFSMIFIVLVSLKLSFSLIDTRNPILFKKKI